MPESENRIAVDPCHGPRSRQHHVSRKEHCRDRRAGLQPFLGRCGRNDVRRSRRRGPRRRDEPSCRVGHSAEDAPRRQRPGKRDRQWQGRGPGAGRVAAESIQECFEASLELAVGHVPDVEHALDRRDAADRFARKRPSISQRSDELPVHVDRAAAHACDDSRAVDRLAQNAGENQILLGRVALQEADDLDLEALNSFSVAEVREPVALHSGLQLPRWQDVGR